jgi:demethylmenaquinone methyltransferase/2-methoxy-6-polyprenyl-1,4-benzoquinol methylase
MAMPQDGLAALLAEQIAYYRARAAEYDATATVDDGSRATLLDVLEAFAPRGRVLELACGTGQWTAELAKHASHVTALDASPEMIALNRARVTMSNVHYVEADLFRWSPPERYDVVHVSTWPSHVPPQRFEDFWALVADCLNERGRVLFVDELAAMAAHERVTNAPPAPAVERALGTGARYRAVNVLHEPGELPLSAGRTRLARRRSYRRLELLPRQRRTRSEHQPPRRERSQRRLGRLRARSLLPRAVRRQDRGTAEDVVQHARGGDVDRRHGSVVGGRFTKRLRSPQRSNGRTTCLNHARSVAGRVFDA